MMKDIITFSCDWDSEPKRAVATQSYIDQLKENFDELSKKMFPKNNKERSSGHINSLYGLPLHASNMLPKGVLCIILNSHNLPLAMLVDETYQPQGK